MSDSSASSAASAEPSASPGAGSSVTAPADAAIALLQALMEMADAADAEAFTKARTSFEQAKTAWATGWLQGADGLIVSRPPGKTAPTAPATAAPP